MSTTPPIFGTNVWAPHPTPLLHYFQIKFQKLSAIQIMFCDIFPLAKQTRLFYSPSTSQSSKAPFDLIHCDICGPHKIHTHTGARYFLTIMDDFTRFTWIHFLNFNSEIQGVN